MFCSISGRSKLSYRVVLDSGRRSPTLKPWSMLAPALAGAFDVLLELLLPPQAARPAASNAAMPVVARPWRIENRIRPPGYPRWGVPDRPGHFVPFTLLLRYPHACNECRKLR